MLASRSLIDLSLFVYFVCFSTLTKMAENFIAEAFALLAIGLVVIAGRLYSRVLTVGIRNLAADDYLMIIAGVGSCLARER